MQMRFTMGVVLALFAIGCAATPETEVRRSLPEPATFSISGTLSVNLTPQLVAQMGLPPTIKCTLETDARSEAISADPLRSRHQGHLKLVLTDGSGKQSLADANIQVSGESDGSPTTGLGQAMIRFLDAASLMTRPISPSGRVIR